MANSDPVDVPESVVSATDDSNPFGHFAPTKGQRFIINLAHRTFLKRGAFRPTMSRLVSSFRAGPVDADYQGASFRIYHDTSSAELGILFNPNYNLPELNHLKSVTPAGGVFVDVGTYAGLYSLAMARHVGAAGRVLSIEPHPVALRRLRFNIAASRADQVTVAPVAVSDEEGEVTIETNEKNLCASRTGVEHGTKVPQRTLAAVVSGAGLTRIHSLKIDVESYEDRVLMPFFETQERALWPRAIVIEHLLRHLWRRDCIEEMVALGYRIDVTTRCNTFLSLPG